MTTDIIKQLKEENRKLKEKVKQLEDQWEQSFEYRDTDYEMFKMEEEAEEYYKKNNSLNR